MATRYSGDLKISVVYDDSRRDDVYRVSISRDGRNVWRGQIGPPASGFGPGIGYDSAQAYDRTAHAALSFADDEIGIGDAAEMTESGWRIRRTQASRDPRAPRARRRRRRLSRR